MVGPINWSMPSVLRRMLRLAKAKSSSGTAVTNPVPAISSACGQLSPNACGTLECAMKSHANAKGASTVVSTAKPSSAPSGERFLTTPYNENELPRANATHGK